MKPIFFSARRCLAILAVVAFLLPLLWVGTIRTLKSNRNDVRQWLPEAFQETVDHRWFESHFPHEQFVLASWEGCTLHDDRLELFANKLVPEPKPPVDLTELLELPPPDETSSRDASSPKDFLAEAEAENDANEPEPVLFKSVLTGPRLVRELESRYEDLSEEEILSRLEGLLIGKDHLKTCLVVTLTSAAGGEQLRPTLEEIRRIATEECNIGENEIYLGGPPVDNVAIDVEGERTLYRLAGLSAIVGLGVSMLCFRDLRLTLMVFWMALLAAGLSLCLVFWIREAAVAMGLVDRDWVWGTCDAILMSMPSLVYVLTISGAVHIVNYYHDAIHEEGLEGAVDRAIRHAFYPCSIASVTTALGLVSLIASDVIPIGKFGLYSAIGVLSTLLLLFFLLPALLYYFPSRKLAEQYGGKKHTAKADNPVLRFWKRIGETVVRHNMAVSLGCFVVLCFFIVGLTRVETSIKLMKLFSPNAEIISHYTWLEDHLGPLVPMEIVLRYDNETSKLTFLDRIRLAEEIEHAVEELDDVGGALSAATFAPPLHPKVPYQFMQATADGVLSDRLQKYRDDFREYLTVDTERTETDDPTLHHLKIDGPLADTLRNEGIKTLSAIEAHPDLAVVEGVDIEAAEKIAERIEAWKSIRNPSLEQLGISDELADRLHERKLSNLRSLDAYADANGKIERIKGIGLDGKQQVDQKILTWRVDHGEEIWRISARVWALTDVDYGLFDANLRNVVEPIIATKRTEQGYEGITTMYTGLVPLVYKAQHELMNGLIKSLAYAFVLIAFVMVFVLRSVSAGLLSMIPNVFPVVVIFGMMGWLGLLVDIGSMMTASVALGVAVDDTIHFLTWYRVGLDQGLPRKGAVMLAYERCATAMTQTTLIGGLGLAVFAFSTFTPTQRFGMLMLTLLAAALVGDLIFLPALLTGPIGRFFKTRRKIETDDSATSVTVPSEDSSPLHHRRKDASHRSRS